MATTWHLNLPRASGQSSSPRLRTSHWPLLPESLPNWFHRFLQVRGNLGLGISQGLHSYQSKRRCSVSTGNHMLSVCMHACTHIHSHTPHTCHRQQIWSWFPKGRARIGRLLVRTWHERWASPEALKWMRWVLLLAQGHPAQAAAITQACWFISSPPRTAAIWWLNAFLFGMCPPVVEYLKFVIYQSKTQKDSIPTAWLKTWLTRQNSSSVTLSTLFTVFNRAYFPIHVIYLSQADVYNILNV